MAARQPCQRSFSSVHPDGVPGRPVRPGGRLGDPPQGDEGLRHRREGDHRRARAPRHRPAPRDRRDVQDLLRQGPGVGAEERTGRQVRGRHRRPDDPAAAVLREGAARRRRRTGHRRGGDHRDTLHAEQLRGQDDRPVLRAV